VIIPVHAKTKPGNNKYATLFRLLARLAQSCLLLLFLKAAVLSAAQPAMSWRSFTLRDTMVRAIRKADIPVLFVQAENDYDLGPSRTLAGELEKLGKPHKI
jgi:hypothetical protein